METWAGGWRSFRTLLCVLLGFSKAAQRGRETSVVLRTKTPSLYTPGPTYHSAHQPYIPSAERSTQDLPLQMLHGLEAFIQGFLT